MNNHDTVLLENNQHLRTKCTVYTRVMGYHRPIETFNTGKKGEFRERKHFVEPVAPVSKKPIPQYPPNDQ